MNLNTSIPFAKGDVFDLPECVAFPEFFFLPKSDDSAATASKIIDPI